MAIICLLTDFGLSDPYVASMKLSLLRHCPGAQLIDATHLIPPHDVVAGSIALQRLMRDAPDDCVHLAVVDPGVGSSRRGLVARIAGQVVVAPDNGLITWPWRMFGGGEAWCIGWQPTKLSAVFHGRDLFAPVAGMLAGGRSIEVLAEPINNPVLLPELCPSDGPGGRLIHIDHFGNAATNLPASAAEGYRRLRVGAGVLPLLRTYADAAAGQALALVNSSGLIEVAVNQGSAADALGLKPGDMVELLA